MPRRSTKTAAGSASSSKAARDERLSAADSEIVRIFAENVKRLRKQRGLDQRAFGDLVGLEQPHVSAIEKRKTNITVVSPGLVFKGGTSLSKGYDAIRRFSEDIDLSFDRADLGYGGDRDPEAAPSRKKADKLIHDLVAAVAKHIETVVQPRLSAAIERELGPAAEAGWSLKIDPGEPQNLIFEYPVSLPENDYAGFAYMSSSVKLELGARGDPWPIEKREIVSYAAQEFPDFFEAPGCSVDVLALRRTF
jgi:transcriptional regulator with XRE-family HTH domain